MISHFDTAGVFVLSMASAAFNFLTSDLAFSSFVLVVAISR